MKRVVIASNNPGKLRELSAMLCAHGVEAIAQAALGVPEAEEAHDTFLENALSKARNAARHTGLAALSDDSGLCVDALGGAPGVHSAHFAGRGGTREERDARNNALIGWEGAPAARASHPREEHLLPLMVAAGAAGTDLGVKIFEDQVLGATVSGFRFG